METRIKKTCKTTYRSKIFVIVVAKHGEQVSLQRKWGLSCNGDIHFYIECTNQIAVWYLYNFTCAATLAVSILHVLYCLPHRADAGHLITTLTHPTSLLYYFVTVTTSSLIAGRILWWCIIWITCWCMGKWQCYVATANQSFFHKYMYKHWISFAKLLLELHWLQGHQVL
jgi:hypothetical protein